MRLGEWDWALSQLDEAVAAIDTDYTAQLRRAQIRGLQGVDVQADLQAVADHVVDSTEVQAHAMLDEVRAWVALALGDFREAYELARRSYQLNIAPDGTALQTAARAAAWMGDAQGVGEALAVLAGQPGRAPAAVRREAEAALAALEDRRGEALATFADALHRWRELGLEFEAAMSTLNCITMLGPSEPDVRAAAEDAGAVFERLGAQPFQTLLADAMRLPASATGSHARTVRAEEPRVRAPTE